jgi:hypothetical protein
MDKGSRMARTIEENAHIVLKALAEQPREVMEDGLTGEQLAEITGLNEHEINDAVALLHDSGYVDWTQTLGTRPYIFASVSITARGRYEHERLMSQPTPERTTGQQIVRPPSPVGSPYGFTPQDWEIVSERKARHDKLYVVLGYQFKSKHYDSQDLLRNVKEMFLKAVETYNQSPGLSAIYLDFKPLSAGYGGHLFNEIARDIIGADIAVFETSDLNPNVMLEMGVALTWDVRVLPIKKEGRRSHLLISLAKPGQITVRVLESSSIRSMGENYSSCFSKPCERKHGKSR